MNLRITGDTTPDEFFTEFKKMVENIEKEVGGKISFHYFDLYFHCRDENEQLLDNKIEVGNSHIKKPDKYSDKVLEGLREGKKQVDIASELGITPSRVSQIKKHLIDTHFGNIALSKKKVNPFL